MMSFLSGLALFFNLFHPSPQAGIVCVTEGNGCTNLIGGGGFINNGPALNGLHTQSVRQIHPEGSLQVRIQGGQLTIAP
jgi:hypothetical protein